MGVFPGLILKPVSAGLLLDTYSAEGGYSFRQLKSGITNVCRLRRSTDDVEQDFTAAEINQTDLFAFVGGGNAAVVTFYDQSGNGNDATAVASQQYLIMTTGVLNTSNGVAACFLNQIGSAYILDSSISFSTAFLVGEVHAQNSVNYVLGNDAPSSGLFVNGLAGGVAGTGGFDGANIRSLSDEDFDQHLWYWNNRSLNLYAARDGAAEANIGTFNSISFTGIVGRPGFNTLRGWFQETIIFNSDESSNKGAIESDINAYYSIY